MNCKEKCCCKVFNKPASKKPKVCRGNVWKEFGGKKYCYSHAKKIFTESVNIIQKYQRGFRIRKIMNNIYIKLPIEIQRNIDKYINQDLQIKKQIDIINKIIFNRFSIIENQIIETNYNNIEVVPGTENIDWFMKYYNICKNITSILNIINNNWNNINLIFEYKFNEPFLVKLFTLTRHGIWGTTVWNGTSLSHLINYIYIEGENLSQNSFESLSSNYFEALNNYFYLFANTFKLTRNTLTDYSLSIRNGEPVHID